MTRPRASRPGAAIDPARGLGTARRRSSSRSARVRATRSSTPRPRAPTWTSSRSRCSRAGLARTMLDAERAGVAQPAARRGERARGARAPAAAGIRRRAVGVLPRSVAQEQAHQAAAGDAGVRVDRGRGGARRAECCGSRPTGSSTRGRCATCWMPRPEFARVVRGGLGPAVRRSRAHRLRAQGSAGGTRHPRSGVRADGTAE